MLHSDPRDTISSPNLLLLGNTEEISTSKVPNSKKLTKQKSDPVYWDEKYETVDTTQKVPTQEGKEDIDPIEPKIKRASRWGLVRAL